MAAGEQQRAETIGGLMHHLKLWMKKDPPYVSLLVFILYLFRMKRVAC